MLPIIGSGTLRCHSIWLGALPLSLALMEHAFNPSTQDAEEGEFKVTE